MIFKLFLIILVLMPGFSFVVAAEKIDLNTATLEELTEIRHIGETRAQSIISSRPFYSLDDLIKIRGIGEKTLNDIKQQGLAWVDPSLQQKTQTTAQDGTTIKPTNVPPSKIDINKTSLEDLTKINHVGEARAQTIISSRPFYSLDDLIEIRGIGEKTLEAIKQQGLAWVDPELEQKRPIPKRDNPLEKRIAALGEAKTASQNKEFVSIFLIALTIAIFSGLIIIIILRLIKKDNF